MSEALVTAIVSAVIAGVFNLIGKRMELSRQGSTLAATGGPGPAITQQSAAQPAGAINYGLVLRHVGILQLVLNLLGFVVGYSMTGPGTTLESLFITVIFFGSIGLSAGFVWSGLKVDRSIRWKYLALVAVGVAITTLVINGLFLPFPLTGSAIIFAFVQTFICMGIGGAIVNRIKR